MLPNKDNLTAHVEGGFMQSPLKSYYDKRHNKPRESCPLRKLRQNL